MKIGAIEIGSGHPCRQMAEVSNNHNGSRDGAKRLITAEEAAGADAIKYQWFLAEWGGARRGG